MQYMESSLTAVNTNVTQNVEFARALFFFLHRTVLLVMWRYSLK